MFHDILVNTFAGLMLLKNTPGVVHLKYFQLYRTCSKQASFACNSLVHSKEVCAPAFLEVRFWESCLD